MKEQLRSAQVAGQWRGDIALTLPLLRRSTVSPVFFGRFPRSSLSLSRPLPTLSPSLIGHLASVDVKQHESKLQALVYDILPSTTAVSSYAIGSRNLSANEQFFVGAQTIVSLLQINKTRRVIYSHQQSLHQHKLSTNRLPVLASFLFGEFLLHIPCWLHFIWGVCLTHPVLTLSFYREFFLHIPCYHNFYVGSLSYTSRAVLIFMKGVSFTHPMLASFLYQGSFSYTSRVIFQGSFSYIIM